MGEIPQPKQFLILSSLLIMSVPDEGYSRNMSGIFKRFLFQKQHRTHYSKARTHARGGIKLVLWAKPPPCEVKCRP